MRAGRRLASNAAYLGVLTLSNYLLGLLIFPYLSRTLSVEAFGLFGFSMAFVVVFQVVVEYGFMISATAKIAQFRDDRTRVSELVTATMLAKCLLVGLAAGGFLAISQAIPMVREHFAFVSLFLVSAVLTALLPDFYFRGIERMGGIALRAVLSKLAALVLIIHAVKGDEQLPLVPAALAVGNLLALILAFAAMRRAGVHLRSPKWRGVFKELREGAGFFASRVASSINQATGAFVLGLSFNPSSAVMGQFAGASRLALAGELAVVPISDALYPHMVLKRDYRLFRRVYLVGLFFWLAGCLAIFIWANQFCALILGEPYSSAGDLLRILIFGTFVAFSSSLFGYPALTPLGLAHHANIALLLSAATTLAAYTALWALDLITAESVCVVAASGNLVVLLYRIIVFALSRRDAGRQRGAL